jgi:hypothetical protein
MRGAGKTKDENVDYAIGRNHDLTRNGKGVPLLQQKGKLLITDS